jgi:serine-type D-Ala-D-Ala carboxypeptidase/endopeptidase (penicillin-binding protein 4)
MLKFLTLSLCLNHLVVASGVDSTALARLNRRLDSLQNSFFLQNGFLGVSVQEVATGRKMVSVQSRKSLQPASTMKLLTTATAMVVLGDSFRFETTLRYDGRLVENTLVGNLYVVGTGDPSLGSWRFKQQASDQEIINLMAAKVKELGIRQVQGRLIIDDQLLGNNPTPDTWAWGDMGNYYGAAPYGLNFHENSFSVTFKPGKQGDEAKVLRISPALPGVMIQNKVLTDAPGTGDQVMMYSRPLDSQVLLEGFVPAGVSEFAVKGAIPNPGLLLGVALQKRLNELGIQLADEAITTSMLRQKGQSLVIPATNVLLYLNSPTLGELAQQTNFQSINLYAEALSRAVALRLGMGQTNADALKAMRQVWQSKGINLAGFNPKDGSGLSTVSSLTAENLSDILAATAREPLFGRFLSTIPVVGESGTVRNLGRGTKATGNVHAKSGSIEGVRAYAGYFRNRAGEWMSFSLMLNRYDSSWGNATKELEKIMVMLVDL